MTYAEPLLLQAHQYIWLIKAALSHRVFTGTLYLNVSLEF
jgi:hypothetical protein